MACDVVQLSLFVVAEPATILFTCWRCGYRLVRTNTVIEGAKCPQCVHGLLTARAHRVETIDSGAFL